MKTLLAPIVMLVAFESFHFVMARNLDIDSTIQSWKSLGWKSLTILGIGKKVWLSKWLKRSSDLSVAVAFQEVDHRAFRDICNYEGYLVIFEELDTLEEVLRCRRPSDSTMVVLKKRDYQKFDTKFRDFNKTRSFYSAKSSSFYHVMTFRDHPDILEHKLNCDAFTCTPTTGEYDFQGLSISGETMQWLPWVGMDDCSMNNKCKTSGVLSDVMDIIALQKNFTWYLRKTDDWGTVALSNGTYSGILGKLLREEHDLPLGAWIHTYERCDLMDITTSIVEAKHGVVINKKIQPIDFMLFMLPLTTNSWFALGSTVVAIFLVHYITSYTAPKLYKSSLSQKISIISSWGFFILINGIYGGALTMFFTSSFRLPFQSLNEAFEHFPEWKMVMLKGGEHQIKSMLTENPSPINDYWEYLHSKDGKTLLVDNNIEMLQFLAQPGYFYYGGEKAQLERAQKNQQIPNMELYMIKVEQSRSSGIGLPKFSPWTRHLSTGKIISHLKYIFVIYCHHKMY